MCVGGGARKSVYRLYIIAEVLCLHITCLLILHALVGKKNVKWCMDSKQAECHQMVEKLPVTRWQRNCHSHQMVEKLSVTRWRRNCHSHQMVEKLSQSPGSEETVTVTRWRRNCHSHQMVEKLSQSPDGGETVTVTTW